MMLSEIKKIFKLACREGQGCHSILTEDFARGGGFPQVRASAQIDKNMQFSLHKIRHVDLNGENASLVMS